MTFRRAPFNAKFLREILHYNKLTGNWTWKVDDRTRWRVKGKRAGGFSKNGYYHIGINRTQYQSSRLAWLWVTGKWPTKDIDHKDGNPSNNKWKNLREATGAQNQWNRRQGKKLKGAFNVGGKWRSIIGYRYKTIRLGTFATEQEAHLAYMQTAKKLFGAFARDK